MSILNNAKAQFKQKLADGVREIEVPEWGSGGDPARLYIRPATIADQMRIGEALEKSDFDGVVETLIVRARDAEGYRLFKSSDSDTVKRELDPEVVVRIVTEINADFNAEAVEDAEKN